jgi:hypothetical protein
MPAAIQPSGSSVVAKHRLSPAWPPTSGATAPNAAMF